MRFKDLTGQVFGELTVIKQVESKRCGKRTCTQYLVACKCGKEFKILGQSLTKKKGGTKHCKECCRKTHGMHDTKLYGVWAVMKYRCLNPKAHNYHNYGGRGIKVCAEWEKNFESFYKWAVEHGYKDAKRGQYTLERIDVNGDYCPENCTWITITEQEQNKRESIRLTFNGATKSLKEWAKITGIKETTLRSRYTTLRWSIEEILTTPVRKHTVTPCRSLRKGV